MIRLAYNGGMVPSEPLAADIRAASEAGFPLLELWMPKLEYALQGGSLNFVKNLLKKANLGVHALVALRDVGFLDAAAAKRMVAQAHSHAATAMSLGAPWVVITPGLRPAGASGEDVRAEFVRLLTILSKVARQYGKVGFALEPEPGSAIPGLALAWEIIQSAGQPNVGLVLDAVPFFVEGGDLSLLTPELVSRIAAVHLADVPALSSATARLLPGAGALPLRDLLRALRSAGFDGVVSADAPGATPGPDAIAVARAASDALEFIARLD